MVSVLKHEIIIVDIPVAAGLDQWKDAQKYVEVPLPALFMFCLL